MVVLAAPVTQTWGEVALMEFGHNYLHEDLVGDPPKKLAQKIGKHSETLLWRARCKPLGNAKTYILATTLPTVLDTFPLVALSM